MRRPRVSLQSLAALVLVALVGSCDNGTTGPFPDSLLAVAELGAQFETVTVAREGVAVTDATVTINGVAIPHTFAGIYEGQLPAAIPAGSPLNLQVSTRGRTVQGTVNVPEAPIVAAPATGAAFDGGDSITVAWTSATRPERFVVSGSSDFDGATFDKTFSVAGNARELRVAASQFPRGIGITFSVAACNDGSFSGRVHPDSRMSICAQSPPIEITISRDRRLLLVVAELGAQFQNVTITREGVPVTNHHVTVNWVAIPHVGAGHYQGQLPGVVGAGSPMDLVLGGDGLIIYATGNGTVPETPVLTAPVAGATFDAGDSITVTWTSATNPDRFVVSGSSDFDGATSKTYTAAGATRELRIAASEFPAGADLSIRVVAYNDGSFTGLVQPESHMGITSVGNPRVITINP